MNKMKAIVLWLLWLSCYEIEIFSPGHIELCRGVGGVLEILLLSWMRKGTPGNIIMIRTIIRYPLPVVMETLRL